MRLVSGYLLLLYVAVASLPLGLVAWLGAPVGGFVFELGRSTALIGFALLVLQGVLAARITWIERSFGLDRLLRFHRHMAILAVALLVSHPVLISLGSSEALAPLAFDVPWPIWAGRAALGLLMLHVVSSARRRSLRLSFERWRFLHGIAALLLLALVLAHSGAIGGDLRIQSLRLVWLGIGVGVGALFVYHRGIRPRLLRRHPYHVAEVRREADKVWTIVLEPAEGRRIAPHQPGQFHFLTLHRGRGLPEEEHHFTISSSPTEEGRISSTIKELGDFTSTIKDTQVGDTASVHGPFGRYSYRLHPEDQDLVFIAGGIGITPLMSMLRCLRDTGDSRNVLLLYANKDEESIVFREELAQIELGVAPRLVIDHVLSRPGPGWQGTTGRINGRLLEQHLNVDIWRRTFYICGPTGMANSVCADLRDLGVPDRRIRMEIFAFVD